MNNLARMSQDKNPTITREWTQSNIYEVSEMQDHSLPSKRNSIKKYLFQDRPRIILKTHIVLITVFSIKIGRAHLTTLQTENNCLVH